MSDVSGDPANLIPANSKLRSSRRLWRVLFFVALAIAVLAVAGRFALDAQNAVGDRIARIKVDGVIATDPAIRPLLHKLFDSSFGAGLDSLATSLGLATRFTGSGHGAELICGVLGVLVVLAVGTIWRKSKTSSHAEHAV